MNRMLRLKLSNVRELITIYIMSDIPGDRGGKAIDYEYTDNRGMLRWMPPASGVYSFVNVNNPEFNKMSYKADSGTGFAELYME